ncbi:MAG: helix-turn-helix transcriptional regulator [bacterium]
MEQGDELRLPAHLREVARLLADGRTNDEIAESLVITRHTAEKYVSELKQLLEARDRVELAFKCKELGSRLP